MRKTASTGRRYVSFAVLFCVLIIIAVMFNMNARRTEIIDSEIKYIEMYGGYRNDVIAEIAPSSVLAGEDTESYPPYLIESETEPDSQTTDTSGNESESYSGGESSSSRVTERETEPPIEIDPLSLVYPNQIPQSDAVGADYFSRALFIGDSRTVGFCNYTNISKYSYAMVSLNIKSVLTASFIEDRDKTTGAAVTRTVLDTLKLYPNSFDKVYISFGVNEYSWQGNLFITCYEYFLDRLEEILPEGTLIYVQSVLPVNEKQSFAAGYSVRNSQLQNFNVLLAEMAARRGVNFVNTAEAVYENGAFALASGAAGDGIHLNKSACLTVRDYLFTHTWRESYPETETEPPKETTTEAVTADEEPKEKPKEEQTVSPPETEPLPEPEITARPETESETETVRETKPNWPPEETTYPPTEPETEPPPKEPETTEHVTMV